MNWIEFRLHLCEVAGAAGLSTFDEHTIPEMQAMAAGRDKIIWNHTFLMAACSFNPQPKAALQFYPWDEPEPNPDIEAAAGKASMQHMKGVFSGNRNRHIGDGQVPRSEGSDR